MGVERLQQGYTDGTRRVIASIMARIGTVFGQRGLLPHGFQMDTDNGAAKVLALLGVRHGY